MSDNDKMSRSELEQLQLERLQSTMYRLRRNVAFYREKFKALTIDVEKVSSVRDLSLLPFTTRSDLASGYPYGFFAVPLKDIVRLHTSSGTTGRPVVIGYTKNDLRHWSNLMARAMSYAGTHEEDTLLNAFHYSLFTGGLGFHYGAEQAGLSVLPASENSDMAQQLAVMRDYKATVIASTPSYAKRLSQHMKEMNIHSESLHLKIGLFGSEPWNEAIRSEIEEGLGIKAFDIYGLSEIMGPGVAAECQHRTGLHVNEDYFIAEIINSDTGEVLKNGDEGELVLTTINKEGFPLLRYRTGDRTRIIPGDCPCGRSFIRIDRILERTDGVVVVRGVKLFPARVKEILSPVCIPFSEWSLIVDNKDGLDSVSFHAVVTDKTPFFDEVSRMEKLKETIAATIKRELHLSVKVHLSESLAVKGALSNSKSNIIMDIRSK